MHIKKANKSYKLVRFCLILDAGATGTVAINFDYTIYTRERI